MLDKELMGLLGESFKKDVKVSRISEDIKGKAIVLYGGNNVGKTKQASHLPNPIFLPCEKGMNAINGAIVLKTNSWADLQKNGRKLTSKKFVKLLQTGKTITVVVDGIERIGNYVKDYLCKKYEVSTIGEARGGFGAWEEYENLVWSWVDNLISVGYTVVFIGHSKLDKKSDKYIITGDERAIKPIRDNADIVAYLESNGVDSEGKEILSTAYLAETDDYFARARFTHMPTKIETFTADNLIKTIVESIKEQNIAEGFESVDFEEQQDIYKNEDNFNSVKEEIKELFATMQENEKTEEYLEVVENHLGEDCPVSEANEGQLELLKCIRNDLEEIIENLD